MRCVGAPRERVDARVVGRCRFGAFASVWFPAGTLSVRTGRRRMGRTFAAAMLAPPTPTTYLLSDDVNRARRPFLEQIFQREGLRPLLPDGETLSVVMARQRRLAWSLLWTVGNVTAGQVPTGAGGGAKVNHFSTSYHLTHKARLVQLLDRQRARLAAAGVKLHLEFLPRVWILPLLEEQLAVILPVPELAMAASPLAPSPLARSPLAQTPPFPPTLGMADNAAAGPLDPSPLLAMVLKPTNASRGDGFHLVASWEDVRPFNRDGYMLQRYVDPPHLLDGYKYHVRLFLLLTALDPPRAYVHRDGYAKRAMEPYQRPIVRAADGAAGLSGTTVAEADVYAVHVTNHRPGNTYHVEPYLSTDHLWSSMATEYAVPCHPHVAAGPGLTPTHVCACLCAWGGGAAPTARAPTAPATLRPCKRRCTRC